MKNESYAGTADSANDGKSAVSTAVYAENEGNEPVTDFRPDGKQSAVCK